jgi:hypothetical protein
MLSIRQTIYARFPMGHFERPYADTPMVIESDFTDYQKLLFYTAPTMKAGMIIADTDERSAYKRRLY